MDPLVWLIGRDGAGIAAQIVETAWKASDAHEMPSLLKQPRELVIRAAPESAVDEELRQAYLLTSEC